MRTYEPFAGPRLLQIPSQTALLHLKLLFSSFSTKIFVHNCCPTCLEHNCTLSLQETPRSDVFHAWKCAILDFAETLCLQLGRLFFFGTRKNWLEVHSYAKYFVFSHLDQVLMMFDTFFVQNLCHGWRLGKATTKWAGMSQLHVFTFCIKDCAQRCRIYSNS